MADLNVFSRGAFGLHRDGISAPDDAAPLVLPKTAGIETRGVKGAVIDFVLESGSLDSFTAEALYWDPQLGQFVSALPGDVVTSTTPGQWKILDTGDRVVFIAVTDLSGTDPVLRILAQPIPRDFQIE